MNSTHPPTILLVDDDPNIRKIMSRQLEHWGYRVVTAASGEEGVTRARTDAPALILLDIMMPKMRGREACAALKADPKTRDIPVIFLTALGLADHIRAGMDLGAEDYVVKPFRPDDLRERIKVCLLRHGHDWIARTDPPDHES
ncbi:MAG: response regulator [Candidatus Omnitrophica bacterium]|nr:response regulator [Candidatus Omnitrophota bacterium]